MAGPKVIAWWSPNPEETRIAIDLPSRERLDELSRQMTFPGYTTSKQSLYREAYRVEELVYQLSRERQLALGHAIPIIFKLQGRFLRLGERSTRVSISMQELAASSGTSSSSLALVLDGLACQAEDRVILFDDLVGPINLDGNTGFISPELLIPTDHYRDRQTLREYVQVFESRRQGILDPVLVLPDPEDEPRGYVCQGHHRVAAAFLTNGLVRIKIIESMSQAVHLLREGEVGKLARKSSMSEFISECRDRATQSGYRKHGWSGYLNSNAPVL